MINLKFLGKLWLVPAIAIAATACSPGRAAGGGDSAAIASESGEVGGEETAPRSSGGAVFSGDSAYAFVEKQLSYGPRVPNTPAHRACGDWLAEKLSAYGAKVTSQRAQLKAFDGTILNARNIFAQFNPEAGERLLLVAHWDCRPWADADPDETRHKEPVAGANDGASGVAVLLEIARQMSLQGANIGVDKGEKAQERGVDILLVDAEDWGSHDDEESWAMGAKYFAEHLPVKGYSPRGAVVLDMVGGEGAKFYREYYSEQAAPELNAKVWGIAARQGRGDVFVNRMGGAITDDHQPLIAAGIPAIDIIEYNPGSGFNPRWHTSGDTLEGISAETLGAVGSVVLELIYN